MERVSGELGPKNEETFFFQKIIFFDHRKLPDRPGPEKMKFEKIENFRLDEWLARPDRTGTGLARPVSGC